MVSGLLRAKAQVAPPLSAAADQTTDVTRYTIERDSLWQRAARVRARTQGRITEFHTSLLALGGTRRKVVSYGQVQRRANGTPTLNRVKRQIAKHKTTGSELEKIYYYGTGNRPLLAEYYQQGQLVRLELYEYPLRAGSEYGAVFREAQWVQGDYLRLTTRDQEGGGRPRRFYYAASRLPGSR